jgi:hypothetical protein
MTAAYLYDAVRTRFGRSYRGQRRSVITMSYA